MKPLLFFPKLEKYKNYHYFPVSLLSVAAPMVADGIEVKIYDERIDNDLPAKMEGVTDFMVSLYTGYQFTQGYKVTQWVRQNYPNIKITWGGPAITAMDEKIYDYSLVDHYVKGDVDTGENPLPYWLVDINKYINPKTERFIYISSYGCPGICIFCATKNKRKYTLLPLHRIRADIDYLMSQYPFRECVFFDATLFTVPDRVKFIAKLMEQYNLQWIADARAPEIAKADDEFLQLCVKSGLKQLTIGLESGSQRVVDIMKKGKGHLSNFKVSAEKLAQLPIKMVSGVVLGTPGETVVELQQTIDYIKAIKDINPNFHISTTFFRPLPNTEMADMAGQYGYRQPQNLKEWAEQGGNSHYCYNEWHNAPWIHEPNEYRAVYEEFKGECKELFI